MSEQSNTRSCRFVEPGHAVHIREVDPLGQVPDDFLELLRGEDRVPGVRPHPINFQVSACLSIFEV